MEAFGALVIEYCGGLREEGDSDRLCCPAPILKSISWGADIVWCALSFLPRFSRQRSNQCIARPRTNLGNNKLPVTPLERMSDFFNLSPMSMAQLPAVVW